MTNDELQLEGVESGSNAARYLLSFAAKSALGDELALPAALKQQLDGLISGINDPALAGIFKRDIATAKDLDEYLAFLGKAIENGENPDLLQLKDAIDQVLDGNLTVLAGVFDIRKLLADEAFHLTSDQTKELAKRHFGMIKDKVAICKLMTAMGGDIVVILMFLALQVNSIGVIGTGIVSYSCDYPLVLSILITAIGVTGVAFPSWFLVSGFNENAQKYIESQIGISGFNELVEKFNESLNNPTLNLTIKERVVPIVKARQQLDILRTQIRCSTTPDSDYGSHDSQRVIVDLNDELAALTEVNALPSPNDNDRKKLMAAVRQRVTP